MATPTTSWNLVRVYGTWRGMDGALRPGTYDVTIPARITNVTDDAIIPAGKFATGSLQTSVDGSPSLDLMVPATDDPDNAETGWKITVEVKFTDAAGEKYVIDVPVADRPIADGGTGAGVNLRTVVLSQSIPQQVALYKVGVPGGLAQLDATGQVVDANGNPVTGSGGAVTSTNITDATTTGRSLLTAADATSARTAIGAGTSSLALGTTSSTAKAGDYQPTAANISDATTVGRNVLKAVDAAAARTAIGAGTGTSNLTIGTTSATAKAGDYQPSAANISDATAVGRSVLTAADAAAARTAISALYTADAFSGQASDLTGLFASTITAMTSNVGRIGLALVVGYNDAGAAWPTVPAGLLSDPNVAVIWAGGDDTHQPVSNSGPSLWIEPVV